MTPASQNNYPQICLDAGLSCEECVSRTARDLASCCKGLRGKMLGQLFVQIYPDPACHAMRGRFAQVYAEASADLAERVPEPVTGRFTDPSQPLFERREVTFARPRMAAAVA